jgi:hypothetical protein
MWPAGAGIANAEADIEKTVTKARTLRSWVFRRFARRKK